MLSCTHQNRLKPKLNQCILRRRARNLRAKVKALLPVQICHKHTKRNNQIIEIQNKRQVWNSVSYPENIGQPNKRWNAQKFIKTYKDQELYYEQTRPTAHEQRFGKLTEDEIEQIKEDRIYYLGQENLEDFQHYLAYRENKKYKSHIDTNVDLIAKTFKKIFLKKQDSEQKENRLKYLQKPMTSPQKFSSRLSLIKNRELEFAERRRIVQFEQKSRITTHKVKLKMKIQRAENNLREIQDKNWINKEIKKENQRTVSERIRTRRQNLLKKPQIKQLQEQLRKTCLAKYAKKFRRTNNKQQSQT